MAAIPLDKASKSIDRAPKPSIEIFLIPETPTTNYLKQKLTITKAEFR